MSNGNGSDNLKDAITANAAGAKSTTVDGTTTTEHSLREQIEADEYLTSKRANKSRKLPIRLAKLRPGGAA